MCLDAVSKTGVLDIYVASNEMAPQTERSHTY
ncbi:hypothetical protein GKR41_00669 [Candidatus Vallotia lariciata]|nr:hypothetical protein GKR41_00669 [Candidatus Vallotia lariciata]